MRKKIIAGNWKMNMNLHESILLADDIRKLVETFDKSSLPGIILAPPFPFLYSVSQTLVGNSSIALAAQNCSHERSGAMTGEVSADMIRSTGTRYVIIGHSERRQHFGESNAVLLKKMHVAIESDLLPIFCVGENKEERNSGRHFQVVEKQLKEVLFLLASEHIRKIIIAYEPVWAIGTGLTATATQAQEMHVFIRSLIGSVVGKTESDSMTILYGGSCNPSNAKELFSCSDIDGGLIGGASLKASDFFAIVRAAL